MANTISSVVELRMDISKAVLNVTELSRALDGLRKTAGNVGAAISKAFAPMVNSLNGVQAGINDVSAKLVKATEKAGDGSNAAEGINSIFSGIAEGYEQVTQAFDKVVDIEKYSISFQDVFEKVVTTPNMGTLLKDLFPKSTELASTVSSWVNNDLLGTISVKLQENGGKLGTAASNMISSITGAFQKVGGALSGLSVGWGAAIAGIVTLIVLLVQNWDTVKAAILTAWETIKQALSTAAEWIDTTVIQPIINFISPIVEWFTQLFQGIWQIITEVVSDIVGFIIGYIEMIKAVWGVIGTWFNENVIQPIVEFFTPLVEWFGQLFQNIWQTIVDIFSNIIALIVGYVETIMAIWGAIGAWFYENVIQPVADFFVGLWANISTWAVDAWNRIVAVFTGVATWFNQNVVQPVAGFFTDLWDGFSNAAKQAWEGVKSVFSKMTGFFKDIFTKAWNSVVGVFSVAGEIFTNIKDGILTAFKSIVNGIIKGLNSAISVPFNGINFALEKIKNINILGLTPFSGLKTINVPQIPYLAKGAVLPANRPFLAVVGDQRHGTNVEAPLATIQEAVALVLEDHIGTMMAGFEALLKEQQATRRTIEGIEIGDTVIGRAAERYGRKMAVVRGGY